MITIYFKWCGVCVMRMRMLENSRNDVQRIFINLDYRMDIGFELN